MIGKFTMKKCPSSLVRITKHKCRFTEGEQGMKVVLAPYLDFLSGSAGSLTYYQNGAGHMLARVRQGPSKREATAEQVRVRSFTSLSAKMWKLLVPAKQLDWQAYAEQYYPKARNGRKIRPSGRMSYN